MACDVVAMALSIHHSSMSWVPYPCQMTRIQDLYCLTEQNRGFEAFSLLLVTLTVTV